jgi:hypothetical protein
MTDRGFNDSTVKKLINIITIGPLVIAGIYALTVSYNFIFPGPKTNISKETNESFLKRKSYGILAFLIDHFRGLFGVISNIFSFIFSIVTRFRYLMVLGLVIYIIITYLLSKSYQNVPFLNDWSNYINVVLILIGASLVISVLSLFIKENNEDSKFPSNKGISSKLSWTLKESIPMYKSILGISLVLGLVFITFYLMKMFKFVSAKLNTFVLLLVFMGLLFTVFNVITKNAFLMNKIINSKILQLLYHVVFLVPCIVVYLTNFIWTEIEDTPSVVWIVLLIELVLIAGYFLLPLLKNWLFVNSVSKKDDLFYEQEDIALDKSVIMNENRLWKLMDKLSVDWDKIIGNDLYNPNKEDALKDYLLSRGYISEKDNRKRNFLQKMFDPSLSLEAAITYVQVNAPVIISLKRKISLQIADSKNLSKNRKDRDNMFKTKILLKDPIYLNKKKSLGNYEAIGSRIGAFNYNYAISAWVFMHEQAPNLRASSNKFTTILDYASKPKIQFKPSENKLRVIMSNSIDKEHVVFETTKFPLQRWNNIIVNYNGGTLDIFINGKLKSTTNNIVPIMEYDGVSVGSENGLSGGICNVVYFPIPLSINKINEFYKSLRYKNPPVL